MNSEVMDDEPVGMAGIHWERFHVSTLMHNEDNMDKPDYANMLTSYCWTDPYKL